MSAVSHSLAQTGGQARELCAQMRATGQLPAGQNITAHDPAGLVQALSGLQDALDGHAQTWGQITPPGSAAAFYADALLYCAAMLRELQQLENAPLDVLAAFSTWAGGFARELLEDNGQAPGEAVRTLDRCVDDPQELGKVIAGLGNDGARGAYAAAVVAFHAAVTSLVVLDPNGVGRLFAVAGLEVAGPDFVPPGRGGIRA